MQKFKPQNSTQYFLLPPSIEDFIKEDHLARVIDEVVERIDTSLIENRYSYLGQKSYHPKLLLKLLLGCYTHETEGANFWLSVLTDLQNRGVQDILIACIDNLKGFAEAIFTVFAKTQVQSCIVHQIRNSLKYIASKDQKEFMKELKPVYQAVSKEAAAGQLEKLSEKWSKKYPVVITSWQRNWEKLTTYFAYPEAIRKLIYTTNTIEGYHRQIRKVTKTKGAFTTDIALLKLIYLATQNIQKKWTQPLQNWSITVSQLSIIFENRISLNL